MGHLNSEFTLFYHIKQKLFQFSVIFGDEEGGAIFINRQSFRVTYPNAFNKNFYNYELLLVRRRMVPLINIQSFRVTNTNALNKNF